MRNASATQAWPRLRPWFEQLLVRYFHRSPAQVLGSVFDVQRTAPFLARTVAPWLLSGVFTGFAWGQIRLAAPEWPVLFYSITLVALAGAVLWLSRGRREAPALMPALAFLGLAGALVWANAIIRPLPMFDAKVVLPATRYTFPVVVPMALVLVGGWWAIFPPRYRRYGITALLFCMIALNIASVQRIWSFYQGT